MSGIGARGWIRTSEFPSFEEVAFAAWLHGHVGALGGDRGAALRSDSSFRRYRPCRTHWRTVHARFGPECKLNWCAELDSNQHCSRSERDASCRWATGAWCSLQAMILPPPRYQRGALPNELREQIHELPDTAKHPGVLGRPHYGVRPSSPWGPVAESNSRRVRTKGASCHWKNRAIGAGRVDRTPDLRLTRAALYRLSYASVITTPPKPASLSGPPH